MISFLMSLENLLNLSIHSYTEYVTLIFVLMLQVQIQLTSCYNDKVYCPCGIAVRAGADIFVINFCDGWSTIQYVACEHTPVLQVSKMKDNNQHYRVSTIFSRKST